MRRYVDGHTSGLEQRVLADFMVDGHFARHIRRMRVLYAERRQHLLNASYQLPLEIVAPDMGMHLIGWLLNDVDDKAAARLAAAHHVHVLALSSLAMTTPSRSGLVLGYAAVNEHEILEGVRHLASALKEARG